MISEPVPIPDTRDSPGVGVFDRILSSYSCLCVSLALGRQHLCAAFQSYVFAYCLSGNVETSADVSLAPLRHLMSGLFAHCSHFACAGILGTGAGVLWRLYAPAGPDHLRAARISPAPEV